MSNLVRELIKQTNDNTVFKSLGINVDKLDMNETIVSLEITKQHFQHAGLVHGGIYVLLAESAASLAAACTLTSINHSVVALEINANHIKSKTSGKLRAISKCLHHGKKTLVYEVRVIDEESQLISMARCTIMRLVHEN